MEIIPQIFTAKVMHKRLYPKENMFTYNIYYLVLPLSKLKDQSLNRSIPINRPGLVSFREKDHGCRDGRNLESWIRKTLTENNLNEVTESIVLITMPRVMGYGFNPVSFWLCLDKDRKLRAVLCEVNNTFGETHSYLCAPANDQSISPNQWMSAEKAFHVSPFMERTGSYRFRFSIKNKKLGIWIDHCDESNNKKLITSLIGTLTPLTRSSLRRAFWTHPLMPLKAITLIHWQALKLFWKGIRYHAKPKQNRTRFTRSIRTQLR